MRPGHDAAPVSELAGAKTPRYPVRCAALEERGPVVRPEQEARGEGSPRLPIGWIRGFGSGSRPTLPPEEHDRKQP